MPRKSIFKKLLLLSLFITGIIPAFCQQMPYNPVSYRLFSPFILNPAITGSKDYLSIDLIGGFNGKSHTQMVSGNARVEKKNSGYGPSGKTYSYTNIGTGAFFYNEFNSIDSVHNSGIGASASYHFPLDKKSLSFISAGITLKGMYHFLEDNIAIERPAIESYFPNLDIGVFYYNPLYYAGLSVTNILDPPTDSLPSGEYTVPVSRQYNFMAAYKFVINRELNLVIEPSLIIHTNDTLGFDLRENIEPALTLYAGNFRIGTYFNDFNKVSFFFQYRYPKFYVGTFFAIPKDSPFYKKSPTAEIAFGINFSHNQSGYTQNGHW